MTLILVLKRKLRIELNKIEKQQVKTVGMKSDLNSRKSGFSDYYLNDISGANQAEIKTKLLNSIIVNDEVKLSKKMENLQDYHNKKI